MAYIQGISIRLLCLSLLFLLPSLIVGQTGTQPRQVEAVDTQSTGLSLPSYENFIMISKLDTIGIDDYRYHHAKMETTIIYGNGDSTRVFTNGDTIFITYPEGGGGGGPGDTTYYWVLQVNGTGNDTITMSEVINLVEGTNIDIVQGATNVTFNVPNMRDTCRHTLVQVTDSTAALLDCLGDTMGIVQFSASVEAFLADTCLQHLYALPDSSNRLVLTDCEGVPMDTIDFFGMGLFNDRYLDSLHFAGDTLTAFIRDTSGIVDSIKVAIVIDSDTDIDSMKLIGNVLHLWEDDTELTVDLSQFMDDTDTDEQQVDQFSFNPTTRVLTLEIERDGQAPHTVTIPDSISPPQSFSIDTTTALFTISDDPTATPDLLVLPWKDAIRNDFSANFTDSIQHNGYTGINIVPIYPLDVLSTDVFGEAIARFKKGTLGTATIRLERSGDQVAFDLMNWGSSFDIRRPLGLSSTQQFMRLDTATHGRTHHYIWHDDEGYLWATDYGQGFHTPLADGTNDFQYILAPRSDGKFYEIPFADLIDTLDQYGVAGADYDFIKLHDDSLMTLVDTLLPKDSSDLHKLIWHGGRVRIGHTNQINSIYPDENPILAQDHDDNGAGLQIYGRRSALDIYQDVRPYIHFRNQFGEFYHRVFDPTAEGPLLPQRYEIGAVGRYDEGDTGEYNDTTDRPVFTIMNDADAYSLNITDNYLQSNIYASDRPVDTSNVFALTAVDSSGRLILLHLDSIGDINVVNPQDSDWLRIPDYGIPNYDEDKFTFGRVRIGIDSLSTSTAKLLVQASALPLLTRSTSGFNIHRQHTLSNNLAWDFASSAGDYVIDRSDLGAATTQRYFWLHGGSTISGSALFHMDMDGDMRWSAYPNTRDDGEPSDSIINIPYTSNDGNVFMASIDSLAAALGATGMLSSDNFANTNLTLPENRAHDFDNNEMQLNNVGFFRVGTSNAVFTVSPSFFTIAVDGGSGIISLSNLFDETFQVNRADNITFDSPNIFFADALTLNNSATDLVTRNSGTGELEYRTVAGLPFLTTEVDGSITNEGALTVSAGTGTTSVINSNTSGSTPVTITAGTGLSISEVGNVITLTNTVSGPYDNYVSFALRANGTLVNNIFSGGNINFTGGDGDIIVTGSGTTIDIQIPSNAIQTHEISDGTILPIDLNIGASSAVDGHILSYNSGVFNWIPNSGLQNLGVGTRTTTTYPITITGATGVSVPVFTSVFAGLVPASGVPTGKFLRDDGTWAASAGGGTVTSVAAGNGLNFTTITGSGSVTLGTPSSVTLASTNSVTATSHTHAFAPGGTTAQYIRGDGSLATLPSGSADQLGTAFTTGQLIVGNGATSGTSFSTLRYTSDILRVGGTHNGISGINPLFTAVAANDDIRAVQLQNTSTGSSAEMRVLVRGTDGSYISMGVPSTTNSATFFGMARSSAHFLLNTTRAMGIGTNSNASLVLGTNNTARMTITGAGAVSVANLTGTGTRLMTVSPTGVLNYSAIANATDNSLRHHTATTPSIINFNSGGTISVGTGSGFDFSMILLGNVGVGTSFKGSSAGNNIVIGNGSAPASSPANAVSLYAEDVSSSSEFKVRDEAGNITTLSPHNFSQIPEGPSEEMAWSFYSERDGKYVNVDMLKLARLVEELTGEKIVYTGNLINKK